MDATKKLLVDVVLNEYDSIRKEIDARTDATKTYGWQVILLAVGTFAGWKTTLNIDLVFFLLPAVVMFIISLGTNAGHDMDKARVSLARIENRVYKLTDHILLSNESCRLIARSKYPWRPFSIALFVSVFFLLLRHICIII